MAAKDDSDLNFLLSQAQTARLDSQLQRASTLLEKASRTDSKSISVLMEKGLLHQQRNQWAAARHCFQSVLLAEPENPQVLNMQAWSRSGVQPKLMHVVHPRAKLTFNVLKQTYVCVRTLTYA